MIPERPLSRAELTEAICADHAAFWSARLSDAGLAVPVRGPVETAAEFAARLYRMVEEEGLIVSDATRGGTP